MVGRRELVVVAVVVVDVVIIAVVVLVVAVGGRGCKRGTRSPAMDLGANAPVITACFAPERRDNK